MAQPPDDVPSRLFGRSEFAAEEKEKIRLLLEQKLGKELLAERSGAGGSKYTYIESHKAIQLANDIFGFNGWSSTVTAVTPDFIDELPGKFIVGATAIVKVHLKDGTFHEDVGYGVGENPRKGEAVEKAKKEAVTDARKRALRLFGNALGNCVYDRQHVKKTKTAAAVSDKHGFLMEPARVPLMPQQMVHYEEHGLVENGHRAPGNSHSPQQQPVPPHPHQSISPTTAAARPLPPPQQQQQQQQSAAPPRVISAPQRPPPPAAAVVAPPPVHANNTVSPPIAATPPKQQLPQQQLPQQQQHQQQQAFYQGMQQYPSEVIDHDLPDA